MHNKRYYGYHRVSTAQQHLDRGVGGIEAFCKGRGYPLQSVFVDKMTGKVFDRPRYTVLKNDILRSGDTLILFELDRLGRSKADIAQELHYFKNAGVRVMFLDIPTTTLDYGDAANDATGLIMEVVNNILIEVVSMIAQTEYDRKRKRCEEGREAMKKRGDWQNYGRPRKMPKNVFEKHYLRVANGEIGSLALMRELGLNEDTYFRYVREYKASKAGGC